MPYKIDKKTCSNCGACETECSVEAIFEQDKARTIDPNACIDCGSCETVCPVEAIYPD